MAVAKKTPAAAPAWPVKVPAETPDETPVETPDETTVETPKEDPDACYIEYREPVVEQVNVPGVGPTAVTSHRVHRVLREDWPAYEKALAEKKGL